MLCFFQQLCSYIEHALFLVLFHQDLNLKHFEDMIAENVRAVNSLCPIIVPPKVGAVGQEETVADIVQVFLSIIRTEQ